jgi:hypothetical protein
MLVMHIFLVLFPIIFCIYFIVYDTRTDIAELKKSLAFHKINSEIFHFSLVFYGLFDMYLCFFICNMVNEENLFGTDLYGNLQSDASSISSTSSDLDEFQI